MSFQFWLRFSLSACVIVALVLISYLSIGLEGEKVKGVKDYPLIWTGGMNEYFREDDRRRNALLIICGLLMDFMLLVGFFRWAWYGTTWRFFFALVFFYGLRIILQNIFFMEFPEGYNWAYPGFFSIAVPYGITGDFFYSGHVGICMIQFLEFYTVGWYWMSAYSLFTMAMQILLMLALRAHYTIDMVSGVVFAHYMWLLSEKYSYLIDWHVFGIPLEKRMAKDRGWSKEEIKSEI